MRKLKLLLAACALMGASQTFAQTDVTSTYLTNANFATGTPIDNNVCTYGKDMAGNGTTYYSAQAIEGWTNASAGVKDEQNFENSGLAGGLFTYGSTPWLAGSGNLAPATDPSGNAGNAAGLCAVWGNKVQYTQDVTLPAGSYTVRFQVYNATSGSGNSSGVITTDLFGFVAGSTTYYAPNNTFAIGQWSNVAVTFNLTEETAGKISMGYVGPSGGAAMPHLFVDNVKILANEMYEDCTSKVNATGWTGASDGYQGGTINTARQYGDKSVGRHIYQTVTGLEKGTYEVALYSISQKEWTGSLANDAGDVAYVFAAEGAYELKECINARARAQYPGDENVGIYTISGVKVTGGTLTLGMGLSQADLTEWHHIQIKSLIRTNAPDLTELITGYNNALAAAKAVDQTKRMAASVKTALNNAIETYDDGKVNTSDGDALEAATDALETATANANTSIASYAIIASGEVSTSSTDGWTCTNANTFHINTWSIEGNTDGTGMTTPFIENWRNNEGYLGEGTFSYTLEGLEPGEVYYAQALIRAYSESGNQPNGPNFFINDVETDMTTAGTQFEFINQYNQTLKGCYATMGGAATVGSDGKITLGARIDADANYNWVAFKNVSIQSMDDAFNAAVAKVTVLNGTIPTAAYQAANAVVAQYSGDNYPTTAAGFETAIAAIEAAATTAATCVEPYATAKTLLGQATTLATSYPNLSTPIQQATLGLEAQATAAGINNFNTNLSKAIATFNEWIDMKAKAEALVAVANDNDEANRTLSTAIATQETNVQAVSEISTTGLATVVNATSTLKAAMTTYVGAANPVGDGAQFDCTFMLTNPDMTGVPSRTKLDGWYTDQTFGAQNSQAMTDNASVANSTDNTKYAMYEYWSGASCATSGYTVYTKVTLPEGTYRMDALCMTGWGYNASSPDGARNISFSAGDVDGTPIVTSTLEPATLDFVQATAGEVKIGLKAHEGNTCNWMGIGYVELYKVPAKTYTVDETKAWDNTVSGAGYVTLNRTIKVGVNTLVLPFSMTQAEVETNFGADSKVYALKSYNATISNLSFETNNDGIAPNQPCLLQATKAGTSYTLEGRTIVAGEPKAEATGARMIGTYAATTTVTKNEKNYIISGGKIYYVDSDVTLKNTRAYIELTDVESTARSLTFTLDGGETTGIATMENGELKVETGVIYDLSGRRVVAPSKGFYIINGKKIVK